MPEAPSATFDAGADFHETMPQVTHTFRLVNTTGRPVRIEEVRKSCTCTEATFDRKSVAPGESVNLTMVVQSQPTFRDWNVSSSLVTDDTADPFWTCYLRFRTYPQAQFERPIVDLGRVKTTDTNPGDGVTTYLEMFEPAQGERRSRPDFDLSHPPTLTVERGAEPIVDLLDSGQVRRLRYPIRLGIASTTSLQLTTGTQTAALVARTVAGLNLSTTASWTSHTPILAAPSNLSFGIVHLNGERVSRKLVLKANDGQPFRILAVTSDSPTISLGVSPDAMKQPATTHTVELAYHRGTSSPKFPGGQIVVQTDRPEMQGRRSLNHCGGSDLEQEVFVPSATEAFHRNAVTAGMLFQQSGRLGQDPAYLKLSGSVLSRLPCGLEQSGRLGLDPAYFCTSAKREHKLCDSIGLQNQSFPARSRRDESMFFDFACFPRGGLRIAGAFPRR